MRIFLKSMSVLCMVLWFIATTRVAVLLCGVENVLRIYVLLLLSLPLFFLLLWVYREVEE